VLSRRLALKNKKIGGLKVKTTPISARDLSSLLRVTEKSLAQWTLDGRLVRLRHGTYALEASFAAFAKHARGRSGLSEEEIAADQAWRERHTQRLEPGIMITIIDEQGRPTGEVAVVQDDGTVALRD
jgi:hypothetical protein